MSPKGVVAITVNADEIEEEEGIRNKAAALDPAVLNRLE